MSAYNKLKDIFNEISLLNSMASVLYWDRATMMPENGLDKRIKQLSYLSMKSHGLIANDNLKALLDEASQEALSQSDKNNLNEMRHNWLHAACVPEKLVKEFGEKSSLLEAKWEDQNEITQFSQLKKEFEDVLKLSMEIGDIKSEILGCSSYEACIDQYEPGLKVAQIDAQFEKLKAFLPGFINEVLEKQSKTDIHPLNGPFDIQKQKDVSKKLAEEIGFNFSKGRIDISTHPFSIGYKGDHRITTRYNTEELLSAIGATIHETGHALYEMGLPDDWEGQPVGQARGMSFHESQSLIMELQLSKSKDYIHYVYPILKSHFGDDSPAWSEENIVNLWWEVKRSHIRVTADEVTYPLHVILRYEIEKALFNKDINVSDIPDVWNQKMQDFIGITPDNDREGCLQDVHWFAGLWGYFPNYTLGAMRAAQFYATAKKQLPTLSADIQSGQFEPFVNWLKTNIHQKASMHHDEELMTMVTGEPLNSDYFINHLKSRYGNA